MWEDYQLEQDETGFCISRAVPFKRQYENTSTDIDVGLKPDPTYNFPCCQVPFPEEFMQGKITTDDISDLPNTPASSGFKQNVGNKIKSYTGKMQLGQRST